MTLSANIQGTVGHSSIEARFSASNARRSDFVPQHLLTVELECLGTATDLFHSYENVRCNWPPSGSSGTQVLSISGSLPDVRNLNSATLNVSIPGIPADTLLDWLHVIDERTPADVSLGGTLTGNISYHPSSSPLSTWDGALFVTGAKLKTAQTGAASLIAGNIEFGSIAQSGIKAHTRTKRSLPPATGDAFVLAPTALALGGKEPATLEGHFDAAGYTLHLTGMASTPRLAALEGALPQFCDGLAKALPPEHTTSVFPVDVTAVRLWASVPVWTATSIHPAARHSHRRRP
jgi:AsmA protein